MRTVIIIPARWGSSRFPGKPMHPVLGVSTLERVWRIARSVASQATVLIATEDERIVDFAARFGGDAVMTSAACANGTERTFEALKARDLDAEIIINLQGDALLTPPWVLDAMIEDMRLDTTAEIVTPAVKIEDQALRDFGRHKIDNPASGTTVVFDVRQHALYFSKAMIPFVRSKGYASVYRHIGLYAFRRESLERFVALPPGPLEATEGLEQLRALEHGMKVRVVIVDYKGRTHGSVDSPGDVAFVEGVIAREGELVPGWA